MAKLLFRISALAAMLLLFGAVFDARGEDSPDAEGGEGEDGDGDGDGDGYGDGEDGDGDGYGDGYGDGDGDGDGDGGGGRGGGELKELTSVADFDEFIDNADASIIGAFNEEKMADPSAVKPADWDDEEDGEWEAPVVDNPGLVSLKAISASEYGSRFAYSTTPEVLEKMKFKPGGFKNGLYLYRSPWYVSKEHERARERFPADNFTEGGVSHWIATKAQPLVGEFNSDTKDRYQSALLVIFMQLDFKDNNKSVQYVLKRARKVAPSFAGKLAIAVASLTTMSYELEDFGLKDMKSSDIRMGIREGPDYEAAKYVAPADKSFSADSLSAFAKSYLAGELTPYKKKKDDDDKKDDDSADADAPGGKHEEL